MRLSLRARVLIGAVLWTVGLVLLSFVIIGHVFAKDGHGIANANALGQTKDDIVSHVLENNWGRVPAAPTRR